MGFDILIIYSFLKQNKVKRHIRQGYRIIPLWHYSRITYYNLPK